MTMEDALKQSEDGAKMLKTAEKIEKFLWKLFTIGLIIAFIVSRFVHPVFASGLSMKPTIEDGSMFICNRMVKDYKTDDIVFIKVPNGTIFPGHLIKRIVGVPGDTIDIRDGQLYVNGIPENRGFEAMEDPGTLSYPLTLGEGEFFCLGDNRNHSADSREYGIFSQKQLQGRLSKNCIRTGLNFGY